MHTMHYCGATSAVHILWWYAQGIISQGVPSVTSIIIIMMRMSGFYSYIIMKIIDMIDLRTQYFIDWKSIQSGRVKQNKTP